jgi:hypothetical protein
MPKPAVETALTLPAEVVERRIYLIRGQKVMIDWDLAELYHVTTGNLNLAVQRNLNRFPPDFMFQLTQKEFDNLILQIVRSSWGGRRKLPYVFTEHGVAMLSSVLRSDRAVEMSILIVRAFVKLREMVASNRELALRMENLESAQRDHTSIINILVNEIEDLKMLPAPPARRIGFPAD